MPILLNLTPNKRKTYEQKGNLFNISSPSVPYGTRAIKTENADNTYATCDWVSDFTLFFGCETLAG